MYFRLSVSCCDDFHHWDRRLAIVLWRRVDGERAGAHPAARQSEPDDNDPWMASAVASGIATVTGSARSCTGSVVMPDGCRAQCVRCHLVAIESQDSCPNGDPKAPFACGLNDVHEEPRRQRGMPSSTTVIPQRVIPSSSATTYHERFEGLM